jgi:YaiO family outer membrane protein
MKRSAIFAAALLSASNVGAEPRLDLNRVIASVETDYLSFSGPYGKLRVTNARSQLKTGSTRVDFTLSQGRRAAGEKDYSSPRLQASLAQDWGSHFSTRTAASLAKSNPVFVNRELIQELSYKPAAATVLTVGGRYARYFGGLDSWSWSAGAAQYFPGGYVSYRFTSYDTSHLGHTTAHLVSAKLSDPYGSTVAWVGHGTELHDADLLLFPEKGRQTGVEVRRLQPIAKGVAVSFGARRTWFETPTSRYHGTGFHIGLEFGR